MSWIERTIADFGRSIGIPELALGPGNRVDLAVQTGATMGWRVVQRPDDVQVLVYRSEPLGFDRARRLRAALRAADFRTPSAWPTRAAIDDDHLVLATRIPERAFTPDALEQALAALAQMHANLGERK